MSTVVCQLFVVRVLERSAGLQPSSLRGERRSIGQFRTTVTESFLFGFSPTSHPRLANYKAFATVYFVLKLDIHLTSNKARKVGLVTVVSKLTNLAGCAWLCSQ